MIYKLVIEVTEDITNPLHITSKFIPNSKILLHDQKGKEHVGRIVDIIVVE